LSSNRKGATHLFLLACLIAYNEKTGEVKSGQTRSPKGFQHWLIKLDGVSDVQLGASTGYGHVEMAYYKMVVLTS